MCVGILMFYVIFLLGSDSVRAALFLTLWASSIFGLAIGRIARKELKRFALERKMVAKLAAVDPVRNTPLPSAKTLRH